MKTMKSALASVALLAVVWFALQPQFDAWLKQDAGYGTGERTQAIKAAFERVNIEHQANLARISADAAKLSADYEARRRQIEIELAVFKRQEKERLENELAQIEADRAEALNRLSPRRP